MFFAPYQEEKSESPTFISNQGGVVVFFCCELIWFLPELQSIDSELKVRQKQTTLSLYNHPVVEEKMK